MAKYTRLTYHERLKIRQLLDRNFSYAEIASVLLRSKSSIYSEIHRKGMSRKTYNPIHAQCDKKFQDSLRGKKQKIFGALESLIQLLLMDYLWSPEQISNRLKLLYPTIDSLHVSHEAIYQYVYRSPLRDIIKENSRIKRKRRKKRCEKDLQRGGIKNKMGIRERTPLAQERSEVGHVESDLIIGKAHKGAVGTIVDRLTRYTTLVHLKNKTTRHVIQQFIGALEHLPPFLRKSLTHDNGSELAHHKKLSEELGILVYFADPGCPWQRPTNENTNRLLREFFPKGTDLSQVTSEELKRVQDLLNNRPRKCLGYRTPQEVVDEIIQNEGSFTPPSNGRVSVIHRLSVGIRKLFSLVRSSL